MATRWISPTRRSFSSAPRVKPRLRHKIYATFMAKPHAKEPGSAMHIHQSVVDTKTRKNIFSNPDGTPSQLFFSHIAGLQNTCLQPWDCSAPTSIPIGALTRYLSAPINVHWGIRQSHGRSAGPPCRAPTLVAWRTVWVGRMPTHILRSRPPWPVDISEWSRTCSPPIRLRKCPRPAVRSAPIVGRGASQAARVPAAGEVAGRSVRFGVHHRQGSRIRGISAGHQLLGARASATERLNVI